MFSLCLGAGCREFESRHSDQKSRIRFCGVWTFLSVWGESPTRKCGVNESRHADQECGDGKGHLRIFLSYGSRYEYLYSTVLTMCPRGYTRTHSRLNFTRCPGIKIRPSAFHGTRKVFPCRMPDTLLIPFHKASR